MRAEAEINAAIRGEGCLGKAAPDEPVFVLRAQDRFAPMLVELWANMLTLAATEAWQDTKAEEARKLAAEMRAWAKVNGDKVPD